MSGRRFSFRCASKPFPEHNPGLPPRRSHGTFVVSCMVRCALRPRGASQTAQGLAPLSIQGCGPAGERSRASADTPVTAHSLNTHEQFLRAMFSLVVLRCRSCPQHALTQPGVQFKDTRVRCRRIFFASSSSSAATPARRGAWLNIWMTWLPGLRPKASAKLPLIISDAGLRVLSPIQGRYSCKFGGIACSWLECAAWPLR